jgi:crotonobetainyl-CoA hydratase
MEARRDLMTDAQPAVLVARHSHTLIITLNRPAAMNAVNPEVSRQVGIALELAAMDADVRAVVLTGAGDRAFCAGADLKVLSRGEPVTAPGRADWGFAGFVNHFISKPTIAAVNGFALGGGTELALASDLVVAVESATFGLPEITRGLFAAAGGVFRLPAQIPRKIAMEMIFTGEPISAARALALGLVNQIVPDGAALEAALALAGKISANAPLAVQASKRLATGTNDGVVSGEELSWQQNDHEMTAVFASEDAREGTLAFTEKRPPVWQGR